jgi:hypothetical protein
VLQEHIALFAAPRELLVVAAHGFSLGLHTQAGAPRLNERAPIARFKA